jgi:hypothetical protein
MTRSIAGVERLFERFLEGPTQRLFRTRIQPEQLVRRIEREMEAGRLTEADRRYVPHRYRVLLHPVDMASLEADRESLEQALCDAIVYRARQRGYRLVSRPWALLVPTGNVAKGEVRVAAEPLDAGLVRSAAAGLRPVATTPRPQTSPLAAAAPLAPAAAVTALVEIHPVSGEWWTYRFDGRTASIGRGPQNAILVDDPRVSRTHGQLIARRGTLVYVDMGSGNGSFVNGTRQREIALGAGDLIRIGHSTLTIRPDP